MDETDGTNRGTQMARDSTEITVLRIITQLEKLAQISGHLCNTQELAHCSESQKRPQVGTSVLGSGSLGKLSSVKNKQILKLINTSTQKTKKLLDASHFSACICAL